MVSAFNQVMLPLLVDCMVTLPGQLFHSTQIPVRLWFLVENKGAEARCHYCDGLGFKNQLREFET